MCALVSNPGLLVARTNQRTISEHNRWRRFGNVKLRNGDVYIGGLDEEFNISQTQGLATRQFSFPDGFSVYKSAVGWTTVANDELSIAQNNLTVPCRNGRMFDLKVVSLDSTETVDAKIQLNDFAFKAFRLD